MRLCCIDVERDDVTVAEYNPCLANKPLNSRTERGLSVVVGGGGHADVP